MGGNSSRTKTDILEFNSKSFAYAHEISDLHYGDGHLFRNEETEEMVIKVPRLDNDEDQYHQRLEDAEVWSHIQHHFLVNLLHYEYDSKREVCSTFFQIMLFYEYLPHNLEKEILFRKSNGFTFEEEEIFYVAKALLSVLDYLQAKGKLHEDVRPFNLLISDNGAVKLLSNRILKAGMNQASMLRAHNMKEQCYLSPVLLESLVAHDQAFSIPYKSDAFSVGLIILELATLRRNYKLYDFDNGIINKAKLEKRLSMMAQRYSNQMVELTKRLLEMEETLRADPGQLLSLIPHNRTANSLNIAQEALHQSKREAVSIQNNSNYVEENKMLASRISMRSGRGRLNEYPDTSAKFHSLRQSPIKELKENRNENENELVLITEYSQKKIPEENLLGNKRATETYFNPFKEEIEVEDEKRVVYDASGKVIFDFVYTASDYNAPFKALDIANTTAIDSTNRNYYLLEKYKHLQGYNNSASIAKTNQASIKYSVAQPAYNEFGSEGKSRPSDLYSKPITYTNYLQGNYLQKAPVQNIQSLQSAQNLQNVQKIHNVQNIQGNQNIQGLQYIQSAQNIQNTQNTQNLQHVQKIQSVNTANFGGNQIYQRDNVRQNAQYQNIQGQNQYKFQQRVSPRRNLSPIHPNTHLVEANQAISKYMEMKTEPAQNESKFQRNNWAFEEKKIQILNEARNDNIDMIINSVKDEHRRKTMSVGRNDGIDEFRRAF